MMTTCARFALLLACAALVPACGDDGDTIIVQHAAPGSSGPFVPVAWFLASRGAGEELYAADADGSTVVKLSPPLEGGGASGVASFKRSPDGRWIAFVAQPYAPPAGNFLFVVPATGGVPLLVNFGTVGSGSIGQYDWSPDGMSIAYIHDGSSFGTFELHVVKFDGTNDVKLSGATPLTRDVIEFAWSPDGSRVVYVADEDTDDVYELYSVMSDGTGRAKVNGTLDALTDIGRFAWAPDGSRIAYMANQGDAGYFPLYTALPDGTGDVLVSPLQAFSELGNLLATTPAFAWAPDGSRLAYLADQDTDGQTELFTVLPDGTGNVKVSGAVVAGGDVSNPLALTYAWSPDSSRLAFIADRLTDEQFELFAVAPDGTGLAKLSGSLTAGGDVTRQSWSSDSSRVAYLADQSVDDAFELHVAVVGGPGGAVVSGSLVPGGDVSEFAWSPSGLSLAYVADQLADGTSELFVSGRDGSGNVRVSGALVAGGNVAAPFVPPSFVWAPDGAGLVYSADQEWDGVFELFHSVPTGAAGNARISGPTLALGGSVGRFSVR